MWHKDEQGLIQMLLASSSQCHQDCNSFWGLELSCNSSNKVAPAQDTATDWLFDGLLSMVVYELALVSPSYRTSCTMATNGFHCFFNFLKCKWSDLHVWVWTRFGSCSLCIRLNATEVFGVYFFNFWNWWKGSRHGGIIQYDFACCFPVAAP